MKKPSNSFVAYIGLDWADTKHDICLQAQGSDELEYDVIPHTPEAIDAWALALQQRFNNQRIAICLELKAGPVVERSGKRCWTHWRYSCPKFLRQTFVEWANQTIGYSYWAREFYDEKRAQGKSHQATLRALPFKWIRIIFRFWKNNTPYDESMYLFALKKRKQVAA